MNMSKARPIVWDCSECGSPVLDYPHQDGRLARCCSPGCASKRARREHPELGGLWTKLRLVGE
jgi:hypothetical protein